MGYVFSVNMLEEGMVPAENITTPDGKSMLVAAGKPLSANYIDMIKRRGVEEVAIRLTDDEKAIYELDHNVITTLEPTLIKKAADSIRKIDGKKPLNEETILSAMSSAYKIVESVLKDAKYSYRLTDYKLYREPSEHAVRVAGFATAVAKKYNEKLQNMGLPLDEVRKRTINLQSIAIAGMLHDIGKSCENDDIRLAMKEYVYLGTKFPGITQEMIPELRKNYDPNFVSYYGYNIIHDNRELPSDVKVMVLLSGEDNVSGPLKTQETLRKVSSLDKQVLASRIINFASIFDEALMENIKEEVTLENAFAALEDTIMKGRFDENLLDTFISAVPLYPEGTKVKLHGDIAEYAVVKKNFSDRLNYTRPILMTVPTNRFVDLRKLTTTTVKNVIGDEVKFSKLYLENLVEQQNEKMSELLGKNDDPRGI